MRATRVVLGNVSAPDLLYLEDLHQPLFAAAKKLVVMGKECEIFNDCRGRNDAITWIALKSRGKCGSPERYGGCDVYHPNAPAAEGRIEPCFRTGMETKPSFPKCI